MCGRGCDGNWDALVEPFKLNGLKPWRGIRDQGPQPASKGRKGSNHDFEVLAALATGIMPAA